MLNNAGFKLIEDFSVNFKKITAKNSLFGEGSIMRFGNTILTTVILFMMLISPFCMVFSIVMADDNSVTINVAWLKFPSDWNTDEPLARITLQSSPLLPETWTINWSIIDLLEAPKEQFLNYDIIIATSHYEYVLTDEDNEKLKFFVENGGVLWIDDCGLRENARAPLYNLFLFVEFRYGEVEYQGQDVLNWSHPLINGIYKLVQAEIDGLGEGTKGFSDMIQFYDPRYEVIIKERESGYALTLLASYGNGKVVITAQDILCALEAGESEDIKFAYNIFALRMARLPLSVTISPVSASILVGQSVTFTSTVSGGIPPYSYQWYVNGTDVEDATSQSWKFTPITPGTYIIHLNVMDSAQQTAKSNTATVTVAPQLMASISPTTASILVGQSVTFTSTVSGGYPPYSYQWYLNDNPVSGATSSTWVFTPTASGIYYIYLKVTDDKGNTAQSNTARITVAIAPVGGYSIPIQTPTTTKLVAPYIALLAILTATFITIKRKTKRKH